MLLLIVAHLLWGIILSVIYEGWSRGDHSSMQGVKFGILVALLFFFGIQLIYMATSTLMTTAGYLVDGAFQLVAMIIVGVTLSTLHGKLAEG